MKESPAIAVIAAVVIAVAMSAFCRGKAAGWHECDKQYAETVKVLNAESQFKDNRVAALERRLRLLGVEP